MTEAEKDSLRLQEEESAHLKEIEDILHRELGEADAKVKRLEENYAEMQKERQESYYDMDSREHLQMEKTMRGLDDYIAMADKEKQHILKLCDSPYFARIDFAEDNVYPALPLYIGRFGFEQDHDLLIYDWRAPVSSMFYDYETGPASYIAPDGRIEGLLTGKRQFKIKNAQLEYVVDTSATVSDDILQEELSKTSDEKMKTIISTIQKEQNKIIRNEKSKSMVIQGVAGSGKTSIALHRIAFLLYRFKNSIKSENVLILSPNKTFADYISGVIPELGEEPIPETSFYELAMDLLDDVIDFEDERNPLDVEDQGWCERAAWKSSPEFLKLLEEYAEILPERIFQPKDFKNEKAMIPAEWIKEQYNFYKDDPVLRRLETVAQETHEELRYRIGPAGYLPKESAVYNILRSALTVKSPTALYRDFIRWIERKDMFKIEKNRIEWPDVYPFLYLWDRYKGFDRQVMTKHLVVDEMQDYTPVQYAVLNKIYPCNKTILGDFSQVLNPCLQSGLPELLKEFPDAEFIEMNKSFRSTKEIMDFALRVSPCPSLETIDRHGEKPLVKTFKDEASEEDFILEKIREYQKSGRNSLGIILKTTKDAAAFYERIREKVPDAALLRPENSTYGGGISVTSIQMAKGLEFDEVVIPAADDRHYREETDRHLLYVACTRAMHRLTLSAAGTLTPFI